MPGTLRHITLGTLRNMPGVNLRAKAIEMWGRVQAAPPARRRGAGRIAERVASFTAPEVADILVRAVKKGKGFAHAFVSVKRAINMARALPRSDYKAEALETLTICAAMRATACGGGGDGDPRHTGSPGGHGEDVDGEDSGNGHEHGVLAHNAPAVPAATGVSNLSGNKRRRGANTQHRPAVRRSSAVDDVPVAAVRSSAAAPAHAHARVHAQVRASAARPCGH